jgi:hypothetical protein
LLSFGVSAAGVVLQASFLWDTMSVGTVISGNAMLATPECTETKLEHTGNEVD